MLRRSGFLVLLLFGLFAGTPFAHAAAELVNRSWTVDDVAREALVHLPAGVEKGGFPVVFVFHGHSGTMGHAARTVAIHRAWPDAIVVYPQGLPTPGELTDHEGRKSGWQAGAGAQGDRDLKFFDTMLADLMRLYHVDEHRVYATGHSNGGAFTYLLWAKRGEKLAAVAPSAAVLAKGFTDLRPKPVLHLASPKDPLVKFSWQERMIDEVLKLNGCGRFKPDVMGCTLYPSGKGADVAVYLHSGGHTYPEAGTELIVKFFQEHPRK